MKLSTSIEVRRSLRVRSLALAVVTFCALTLTGCTGLVATLANVVSPAQPVAPATEEIPWGQGDPLPEEPALSPPTTDTTTMLDPVAGAFTVDAPVGWSTTAYSTGMFSDHR
ncbi:MAG: hypothetical protein GX862_08800, partial [Leucobacter sp.]|nr:hypothetical protein [Leucobacter sp.]